MICNHAKIQERSLYFPSQEKLTKRCLQSYSHQFPLSCVQTSPPPPTHATQKEQLDLIELPQDTSRLIDMARSTSLTAFFSIKAVYLETATTTKPLSTKISLLSDSIANIVQQPKYYYHAKFDAFTPKCTIFFTIWLDYTATTFQLFPLFSSTTTTNNFNIGPVVKTWGYLS